MSPAANPPCGAPSPDPPDACRSPRYNSCWPGRRGPSAASSWSSSGLGGLARRARPHPACRRRSLPEATGAMRWGPGGTAAGCRPSSVDAGLSQVAGSGSSRAAARAVVGMHGGHRRRDRRAVGRRRARCGRARRVSRADAAAPRSDRGSSSDGGERCSRRKFVAVSHGVPQSRLGVHGCPPVLFVSASGRRSHCAFASVSGAAPAGAANVSCCVIASARLSAGPGRTHWINGHGACRACDGEMPSARRVSSSVRSRISHLGR
jgi:hypothetical protein